MFQTPSSLCWRSTPKPSHKMDSAPNPTATNPCPYGRGSQKYPLKGNGCLSQKGPGNPEM